MLYLALGIVSALVFWLIIYCLLLRCRRGHKDLEKLRGWSYAHRGLHGNGVPENSMTAFRLALEGGYGIELDVHLMADGRLAVIHDASLKRTAGADIKIEALTAEDLGRYTLEGTEERIPLFEEVLALFEGKAPMIIELKAEGGNHAALAQAVCTALESYRGDYCLESFDPRVLVWLKKNRPCVCRGQLSRNFIKDKKSGLSWILKFAMSRQLVNFLVAPDFVAFRFDERRLLGVWLAKHLWGAQCVGWTITTAEAHAQATKEGWLCIFEGFRP